ncbi:MFS transporter [Candidatus Woesearchaeota archaeon]|nr:MFS transporter [Candidatus Woesearchaeota archaeon]
MHFFDSRKELRVPMIVNPVFNLLTNLMLPVLAIYFQSVGIEEQWLGVIFSFLPLSLILFSPVVGIISDHVGRKRVIYAGAVAETLSVAIYIWLPTIPMIILARILSGIGWAAFSYILLAKVEDKVKDGERGSYMGLFLAVSYIGLLIGPIVGAYFADKYSLRMPFILAFFGLIFMIIWLVLWKSHHKPALKKRDFNPLATIGMFMSVRKLRAIAYLGMSMHMRLPVFKIFIPLLVLELGYGVKEVGIVFFLVNVAHLIQMPAGKVVDKKGSALIIIISVLGASAAYMIAGFAFSLYALIFALVLEAVAESFWNVSAVTYMAEIGERNKFEGVVVGSYSSLAKVGHFAFSLVSGFIAVAFGIRSLFLICAVASLVVCAVQARTILEKPVANVAQSR